MNYMLQERSESDNVSWLFLDPFRQQPILVVHQCRLRYASALTQADELIAIARMPSDRDCHNLAFLRLTHHRQKLQPYNLSTPVDPSPSTSPAFAIETKLYT